MKKTKSKKVDNVRLFASAYLSAVARNLEYVEQIKRYEIQLKQLESSNTVIQTEPGKRNYHIKLKMFTNREEKVYYFTDIVQLIQFNSPALLVKILREVHHNYSCLNLTEMATALNKHQPSIADYSESIPNELHILKMLADAIEQVKEVSVNC